METKIDHLHEMCKLMSQKDRVSILYTLKNFTVFWKQVRTATSYLLPFFQQNAQKLPVQSIGGKR